MEEQAEAINDLATPEAAYILLLKCSDYVEVVGFDDLAAALGRREPGAQAPTTVPHAPAGS